MDGEGTDGIHGIDGIDGTDGTDETDGTVGKIATDPMQSLPPGNFISWFFIWVDR